MFLPFMIGAELVIAEPGRHGDGDYLARLIGQRAITVMHFVPSMLSAFTDALGADRLAALDSLRVVFTSGEALTVRPSQALLSALPAVRLVNLYGPTEAAVDVTAYEVGRGDTVIPIGVPVPNTSTLVLDGRLRPVPQGVPGELYLGGVQVARGYAAQSTLTAERFVADPFGAAGTRLYRTGDLVRWNAAGRIEYLGRTDFQVKLRGQRLELGEVEAVLADAPGVVHAAAAVVKTDAGAEHLVGYLVPAGVDTDAVKAFVAQKLPEYMVPTSWVLLDVAPLNSAGKLDRRALPAPDFAGAGGEFVAPDGETEELLAAVVAGLLGHDRVSVTESFFALGGNSLSAMRLAARASDVLGVAVSVRDVFESPSVRELVAATSGNSVVLPPITAVEPRPQRIPLAFAQQRMWFINQLEPDAATYNIPLVVKLTGRLDVAALRHAVVDLVVRHESLRTTYPAIDGVPYQVISDASDVAETLDWAVVDTVDELWSELTRGFDVSSQWPVRVRITGGEAAGDGTGERVLGLVVHHISADGESVPPLFADLAAAYVAQTSSGAILPDELPVQFADFSIWQHEVLGSPGDPDSIAGRQLAYWRTALAGLPDLGEIPTDRPRPPRASERGAVTTFGIPSRIADKIDTAATEFGVTRFMVVQAALAALISRLSASDDIAIATPVAGRGHQALDRLVGMFVNTLILRTHVDLAAGMRDMLAEVRTADLDAFAHGDVPFDTVVDASDATRSGAFAPFSQVSLTFEKSSVADYETPDHGTRDAIADTDSDLTITPMPTTVFPARLDLLVAIAPADGDWTGSIIYATDLFDESTIAVFGESLVRILDEALADADRPLGEIRLAGELGVVNGGRQTDPQVLGELLRDAATRWGDRPAVTGDGVTLTYRELDERSNRLARWLIGRYGVGADDLVALAIPRSVQGLTAIWAVAKTGAGYVAIDPDYPADRVAHMISDSAAVLGLSTTAVGQLPVTGTATWSRLDDPAVAAEIAAQTADTITPAELVSPVRETNIAYVIYTSGSTGKPKGVAVTHSGLLNLGTEEVRRAAVPEGARVLGFATPSFDASVFEYMMATMTGGTLVYRPNDALGGEVLQDFINGQGITLVGLTPTVLATLDPATLTTPNRIYVGGEAISGLLKDEWSARWPMHNLYGPTEATVGVTITDAMRPGDPVDLGGPIAGADLMVLDSLLGPVPVGVSGELYVAGCPLARGYLHRPDVTADRFVANPFGAPGERMYRTGDVVRWRYDHQGKPVLEFSGRNDDQVKLRGLRIELGEIEAVLDAHPDISSAVVIGIGGQNADALAAYVVGDAATVDVSELKAFVAQRMPVHMVPASITVLDAMPLTPVGKLDKRALPDPMIEAQQFVAPVTDAEAAVARVFTDILGVDEVSVTASFFDLGGNSLSATKVVARVSEVLGVTVSVREVFDAPSVRELIAAVSGNAATLAPILAVNPRPAQIPLSFAQARMWFINQYDTTQSTYNVPAVLRLTGNLDVDALERALIDLVDRQQILRTVFPTIEGVPGQQICEVGQFGRRRIWQVVETEEQLIAEVSAGFDVSSEWPLRVRLLHTGGDEYLLGLVVHHIAADGESMLPLLSDIVTAYTARSAGAEPQWQPLPVQFADFAIWQHEVLGSADDDTSVLGRQLAYWREQLAGLPEVIELPTDRPRPQVASRRGDRLAFEIPAHVGQAVEQLARTSGATPFMVVHAALSVLLARLSASTDIAVATPIAGRGRSVLEPLVGMFVNTLVLRSEVDPSTPFGALLEQIRTVDLAGFTHADVPFESVVEAVDPVRSEAFSPLAQVMFSFDPGASAAGAPMSLSGLSIDTLPLPEIPAQLDLSVVVSSAPDGSAWEGGIVYAVDLFDASTIEKFAATFVRVLEELIARPSAPVGDVDWLSGDDDRQVREQSTGSVVSIPDGSLPDILAARAASGPDAVALWFEGREVSYAEFSSRVSVLARELISAGVGADDAVGVSIDRGIEMVVAIHAVVAAGGQYVPIAPDAPADRVQYMMETADVRLVLIGSAGAPDMGDARTIVVDCSGEADLSVAPVTDADRLSPLRPDNAIYTLFTSGSTGKPKGVTLSHAAVLNRLWWGLDELPIDESDSVVLKTPYTFDVSVPELFAPLMIGARMVVLKAGGHIEPLYVAEVIEQTRATMVHFVPSMLAVFVDVVGVERISRMDSVRIISLTGEAVPPAVAADVRSALPDILFYNLYGPTEAAVEITYESIEHAAAADPSVPIGIPMWNSTSHVLDGRLHRVPDGVVGELYLGGVQLARGYAARPDLSAERFVADPFGSGERMYRTGDLVRRRADGVLEYLGRTDFQVKLRGQRIELGEIEAVLSAAPGVVTAAVTVAEAPGGGDYLVGYVSPADADVVAIAASARGSLAEYMIPSAWMTLDELPLNSAGKIDRKALPAHDPTLLQSAYVAPEGHYENIVATIFADVLGLDEVSATASFFDLGGNSLSAVRVVDRLRKEFNIDIGLAALFTDPSVRAVAALIESDVRANNGVLLPLRTEGTKRPLFCVHPAGGVAWFYGGFAPYLADRPIYGLQDPHVVADEVAASSVVELAERYVAEIKQVQPEGPYNVLGWSLGGTIAHAIVALLQQAGDVVAYLGIMDAVLLPVDDEPDGEPDGDSIDEPDDPADGIGAGHAAAETTATGDDVGTADVGTVDLGTTVDLLGGWRELFNLDASTQVSSEDELIGVIRNQIASLGLLTADEVDRVVEGFRTAPTLVGGYRPLDYTGDVQLFVATADKSDPSALAQAWRAFVTGDVSEVFVDTYHLGMADPDSLAVIGPELRRALDAADTAFPDDRPTDR
ncbi:non-ribosomal peptide synthetase [Gordonia sp. (in: high G+C Gram-positive bacteria)]|uniref:non-ribosomal peptide synthetase n=1 Tax=Gordonia sp. (in: high G+C Gram-positive bacteria) TaxID=84139 RepID=UPI002B904FE2|nr:non-ribosomal peptide synthetase [Gordonia sp. (in: high G+C Gram-positive bacteria)]HMS75862.1 amino acid adenylation domain-containing protein [Gordonia sp. (in: high G+C Gram-positive bacteria)]